MAYGSVNVPGVHKHKKEDITDFPAALLASDVSEWAKSKTKPSYTAAEVGAAASGHTHTAAQIGAAAAGHRHTASEVGALGASATATAATKLATARTIRTNLGSTGTASFDGTANVTPGVTGTLPAANGGTGATSAAGALYALTNGATALSAADLATGDYIPVADASAGTGKKITVGNLKAALGAGCGLKITFTSTFSGKSYTVTGGGESYSGTVPSGLVVEVAVQKRNTTYTVSSNGYSVRVRTGNQFGFYPVTLDAVSATLNSNSWEQIQAISAAGQGANYWSVGDCKTIAINGKVGETQFDNLAIDVFILGFDHNANREGGGRIHFQIGKIGGKAVALCDSQYNTSGSTAGYFRMNNSSTNSGGWKDSYMRKTLLGNEGGTPAAPLAGSLMAALPADLRMVMKPVTKYTDNTGGTTDITASKITATQDYLFGLGHYEVFGSVTNTAYVNKGEAAYQEQYEYYKAGNSRIAYNHTDKSTAVWWWLRSPSSSNSYYFRAVNTGGTTNSNGATYSAGLRPGFSV